MRKLWGLVLLLLILLAPRAFSQNTKVFEVGDLEWLKRPSDEGGVAVVAFRAVYLGSVKLLKVKVSFKPVDKNLIEVLSTPLEFSTWSPGEVKLIKLSFRAKRIPCNTSISIIFSWSRESTIQGFVPSLSGGSERTSLKLIVRGEPSIRILVKPSRLIQGSVNTVKILLQNTGIGVASGVKVTISFQGLSVDSTLPLVLDVGELKKGDTYEKTIRVTPVSITPVMTFLVEYINEYGELVSNTVVKQLYATSGGLLYLIPSPSTVYSGRESLVKLKIVNAGEVDLQDITVRFIPSSTLILNTTLVKISELKASSETSVKVLLLVPQMASGPQTVNYEIMYKTSEGTIGREAGTIVFNVLAVPELRVISFDAVPSEPKVNKPVTVSITILNTGASSANNLNISLVLPKELTALRRSSMFIGRLEPQIPSSTAFSITASKPGEYFLKFVIEYTDAYGKKYTLVKQYKIKISEEKIVITVERRDFQTIFYISLIALAAAVIVVVLLIKKYGVKRK
ncbi:MAG TPA: hypothetical protein ENF55_03185 [Thermoprotei archaeon]|nr:MAG: hypothetical protein DRJ63_08465 [Thermoprotei archaeon]HDI74939.1 hypothetical protein [Thermoprotei archaeon]